MYAYCVLLNFPVWPSSVVAFNPLKKPLAPPIPAPITQAAPI